MFNKVTRGWFADIASEIPDIDDLNLSEVLEDVVMTKNGLVIMVEEPGPQVHQFGGDDRHRNRNSHGHITIEAIEYVHPHKGCHHAARSGCGY